MGVLYNVQGDEESNAARRRYPKSAATVASSTRKNVKLVHKVVSQSQFSILQLIRVYPT